MTPQEHRAKAVRIERSLLKCGDSDFEIKIEGAMLAGTHWLNAVLHQTGVTEPDADVFHTYLLTVNEYRRLSVAEENILKALTEIEDLRPAFVRGNVAGADRAAGRAIELLSAIRAKAKME